MAEKKMKKLRSKAKSKVRVKARKKVVMKKKAKSLKMKKPRQPSSASGGVRGARKVVAKKAKKVRRVAARKPAQAMKPKAQTKAITAKAKVTTQQLLGKVVHYYDRIGVAIVELDDAVKQGDIVRFQRGDQEFSQPVGSMQVNHQPVMNASKGQVIGLKVKERVERGTVVLPAVVHVSCNCR